MHFCVSGIERYLLFSSLKAIRGIAIATPFNVNGSVVEAMTPITGNATNFVGLDYDAADDYIYYADVRSDVIWRVHTNGTGERGGMLHVPKQAHVHYFRLLLS